MCILVFWHLPLKLQIQTTSERKISQLEGRRYNEAIYSSCKSVHNLKIPKAPLKGLAYVGNESFGKTLFPSSGQKSDATLTST